MLLSLLWPSSFTHLLLLLNALLGGLFFNHIWKTTQRYRQPNFKLEQGAISMYRRDARRWNYVKLFLASITFGLPRFILVWLVFGICLLLVT